ncbi:MAG: penicillin-insensitive murein endopeptidase [Hyphomicrobiales bacterium]
MAALGLVLTLCLTAALPTGAGAETVAATMKPPLPKAKPDKAAVAKSRKASARTPAKQLFGAQASPANIKARSLGSYARGCLAGAKMLDTDGPAWQAMRLSRNRNWGHPALIAYIEKLAVDAKRLDGWPGLLVGDLSQPRGGPMLTGHSSHQVGLDADVWMLPSPGRQLSLKEREQLSSISVIKGRRNINSKTWTERHAKLLKRAASYPQVARIFVHPAIKKQLCKWAKGDRSWLRRIRPWYGHHYHFHVRLKCPKGSRGCKNQSAPPGGTGCGKSLNYWLSDAPYKPRKKPKRKKRRRQITLSDLPNACRTVLEAN